jgi:hypothetical protein
MLHFEEDKFQKFALTGSSLLSFENFNQAAPMAVRK